MFTAFYNGINGVKGQSFGIDTTSNNISNVNTPGFRYSITEFSDIFNKTVNTQGTNPAQAGFGAVQWSNKLVFEQGSFIDGGGEFDVALAGKGFFGVTSGDGVYYTRNGSFMRDANGNLVDSNGNYVLGTMNPNFTNITYSDRVSQIMGSINGEFVSSGFTVNNPSANFSLDAATNQGILSVPTNLYYQPQITNNVSFKGNISYDTNTELVEVELDPENFTITEQNGKIVVSGRVGQEDVFSAKAGERVVINFTDANGVKASAEVLLDENLNFQTNELELQGLDRDSLQISSASVYTEQERADNQTLAAELVNSDGTRSKLIITLTRVLPQVGENYEFEASAQITDWDGNPQGGATNGRIVFNQAGALIENTITAITNPNNNNTININLGSTLNDTVSSGYDGIYIRKDGGANQDIVYTQDGIPEGFFSQYDVLEDGSLVAQFTNGKTATVAKLALYNFINEQGLASVDGTNFVQTGNSGEASFLYDEQGNLIYTASFVGDKLEASNADLSVELTNLIVMQKAFDASSKSITTSDEMIRQAINMKN